MCMAQDHSPAWNRESRPRHLLEASIGRGRGPRQRRFPRQRRLHVWRQRLSWRGRRQCCPGRLRLLPSCMLTRRLRMHLRAAVQAAVWIALQAALPDLSLMYALLRASSFSIAQQVLILSKAQRLNSCAISQKIHVTLHLAARRLLSQLPNAYLL